MFEDPAGDHDWGISATVDIAESNPAHGLVSAGGIRGPLIVRARA
ncbi:hypothetical protein [Glaciihabitans sp. UYNi722]